MELKAIKKEAFTALWVGLWGVAFALPARGQTAASTVTLSMDQAIERAVQTQLTTRLAQAVSQEARGHALQTAASLLPQITAAVSQSRTFKENLAAQGFPATPFLPDPLIGPFNTFDARFQFVQKILDFNNIWNRKSARAQVDSAKFGEDLAAEQVASAAATAYIEDLRAARNLDASQSNLDLAQRLSDLAHHQHDAGLATGVDVARAETAVTQNRQALIRARLTATEADIRLKRVVGMKLGDVLKIDQPAQVSNQEAPPSLDNALTQAQSDRLELRITNEDVRAQTYALDAARASHLPSLSIGGDYGYSGATPDEQVARTGRIGASLEFPVFSGGATRGQVAEARGRLSAAQNRLSDARLQVEEDVRLALETLSSEIEELGAAETQVSLAERELKLAEDRYRAGVGDNIQVVTAQNSLSEARRSEVDVRARYADARASLALAVGHMRDFSL